jgi:hypothetical protein
MLRPAVDVLERYAGIVVTEKKLEERLFRAESALDEASQFIKKAP